MTTQERAALLAQGRVVAERFIKRVKELDDRSPKAHYATFDLLRNDARAMAEFIHHILPSQNTQQAERLIIQRAEVWFDSHIRMMECAMDGDSPAFAESLYHMKSAHTALTDAVQERRELLSVIDSFTIR